MKIKTGVIKEQDKTPITGVNLEPGTRKGTMKLTVDGTVKDNIPVRGLSSSGGSTVIGGGSTDLTSVWEAINNKLDVKFFKNLFTTYDSNDREITPNTYINNADTLKISVGTWSEGFLSALGENDDPGGGGGYGTVEAIRLGPDGIIYGPEDGLVTLPAYPSDYATQAWVARNYVDIATLHTNYYTKTETDNKFLTRAFFDNLFTAYTSGGNVVSSDDISAASLAAVDNLKILVGTWTEEYLSALGNNPGSGGGGTGTVEGIRIGAGGILYSPTDGIVELPAYPTSVSYATSAGTALQATTAASATSATNAVTATTAEKLSTVSKTAWGQTYWTSGGIPDSISGDMTNVGNISFSASGKNIGGLLYFDTTNSRIGIGTNSPSYKLHVAGDIYTSADVTAASDMRYKEEVQAIDVELKSIVEAPNLVFKWNDKRDDFLHGGTYAQYWKDITPWYVRGSEDTFYSLNYACLSYSLVVSLSKEIQKLKEHIKELEEKL